MNENLDFEEGAPEYNRIPKKIELFGRVLTTIEDNAKLNFTRSFGEARYGVNQIAIANRFAELDIPNDERKITYLHEMLHFILNFTGYEKAIGDAVDIEQFIELMASAIYQYEKSAEY